jgi:hypothetical protein
MFVKVLKSFVGIVGSPPPPACGSMVVKIGYTEEPNVVQSGSISTRTVFEKGCQGSQVAELEGFANTEFDRRSRSALRRS